MERPTAGYERELKVSGKGCFGSCNQVG